MSRSCISFANRSFTLFFIFCTAMASGQWIKLPEPVSGITTTSSGPFCGMLYSPEFIVPFSNGGIVYTTRCQLMPQSGSHGRLCYSLNDLSTVEVFRSISPAGLGTIGFQNLRAWGDSVITWTEFVAGYAHGFITTDQFKTVQPLSAPLSTQGTWLTPHYLYTKIDAGVYRTDRTDNSGKLHQNTSYQSYASKIQFANDSVGFMIATPKTATASSVLIRTKDYGETWQTVHTSSTGVIVDFDISGYRILVLSQNGTLSESPDLGDSWQETGTLGGSGFITVHIYDQATWFAGADGGILMKTTNSGASWANETTNTTNGIKKIYNFGDRGYFVTSANEVFKSAGPVGLSKEIVRPAKSKVWPTPAKNAFHLSLSADHNNFNQTHITIHDGTGTLVFQTIIHSTESTIETTGMRAGIYFLRIKSPEKVETVKVCIE